MFFVLRSCAVLAAAVFFFKGDVAFAHLAITCCMSVGQLARSFQAEAPVLYIQQNPDYEDNQMTRIPLIFSIGSIFAWPSLDHVVGVSPSRRS